MKTRFIGGKNFMEVFFACIPFRVYKYQYPDISCTFPECRQTGDSGNALFFNRLQEKPDVMMKTVRTIEHES